MFSIPFLLLCAVPALEADSTAAACQDSKPATRNDPMVVAESLERSGDFLGAARALELVLAKDPNNAGLQCRAGILWSRSDAYDDAEKHLSRAVELEPKNREFWLSLGEARFRSQQYNSAIDAFDKAGALDDGDGRARNGLGAAYFSLGKLDKARQLLTEAAERNARLPGPRFTLGRMALDDGDLTSALRWFDECLKLDSRDTDAWFRKGLTLRRMGRPEEAIAAFRSALQCDPTHPGSRLNLGQALMATGREAEGKKEIENHGKLARGHQRLTFAMNSLRLDARSASSRVAVGDALLELGLWGEALDQFKQVLHAKPPMPAASLGCARAAKELGHADIARAYAEMAIHEFVKDPRSSPSDLTSAREFLAAIGAESRSAK